MTELLMASLLTGFADPIRVACFAGEVSICLAGILFEVQSHALERLIACELHWATRDHNNTALSQSIGCKRCVYMINDSLLAQVWHSFLLLLFFVLLRVTIEAS